MQTIKRCFCMIARWISYVLETVCFKLIVVDFTATRCARRVVPERRQGVARVVFRRAGVSAAFRTASSRLPPG